MVPLSVVIPTRNEEENIKHLIERLHTTLSAHTISYQIIIIDDHSSDNTFKIASHLSSIYPIVIEKKKGQRGKAFSILQGVKLAAHDLVATIDADLQYAPEMIPSMVEKIKDGADIVIAERFQTHPSFFRRMFASLYKHIFAHWMHKLPHDVNSGLKVFKKKILKRVPVSPAAWTFDMEFILKAAQAGYVIKNVPVEIKHRKKNANRRSNNNILDSSYQLAMAAFKHKLARSEVYYFDEEDEKVQGRGFHYAGKKFVTHNKLDPHKSALYRLHAWHVIALIVGALILGVCIYLNWHLTILVLFAALTILYFADLLFNLYLISRSFFRAPELSVSKAELDAIPDSDWPTYTIFCPLYKEPEVIPQFVTAMSKLNYPADKL
ncbi:MAG: dolichol-phosphate mannosyltransferase, partial [Patescibacteria group bacterium]|nr:dolichol-phosphate mannosyltransferase [Patescibacteria group bacterium]